MARFSLFSFASFFRVDKIGGTIDMATTAYIGPLTDTTCRDCYKKGKSVEMKEGTAFYNTTLTDIDGKQCYPGAGRATLVRVLKCPECGHSYRL